LLSRWMVFSWWKQKSSTQEMNFYEERNCMEELENIIKKLQEANSDPEFNKAILLECSAELTSLFNRLSYQRH
ncbi:TPA: hypothetical protein ACUBWQ_002459, partial [Streptococcus agalactiae]